MTPEEFNKIKEAEKEHLRKVRELKKAVRALERQKSITDAIRNMTSATEDVLDTQAQMVEKLAMETAMDEARLELAMEGADDDVADEPDAAAMDAEMQAARARQLIRQMKIELGGGRSGAAGRDVEGETPPEATAEKKSNSGTPSPVQDSSGAAETPSRPEKTIGRM